MTRQFVIFLTLAIAGIFAQGSDSGSMVLESGTRNAVGLLWGGNGESGQRALMSDITTMEQRLNVSLVWAFA